MKGVQSKMKTMIKKAIIDVIRLSYKKMKLFGVGFRISSIEFEKIKLLKLEVGYSHSIYFRVPDGITVSVSSPTKFIVSGTCDRVGEVCSKIRKIKIPEPYKGKGILYESEEVSLKAVVKKS
jgi:large subunit ribosomal protein L6